MRFLALTPLFLGLASAMESRTWVDTQNRKLEATLIGVKEGAVLLQLKDGKEVDLPITKLSAADVAYVDKQRDALKKAAVKPEFNFDSPWPDRVSFKEEFEVKVVEEDKATQRFTYESENFRYLCDVPLARSVVRGFAQMFEASHLYCMALPIGMTGGRQIDGKYQILLFEKESDYIKEGGPPGSAGVFVGSKGIIMVPLTSLGVRLVGTTYILNRERSSKTLPHEIAHQLTPKAYYAPGSRGWFTEGLAEYVAITPYTSGTYNVGMNLKAISEYVTEFGKDGRGGRNLGDEIKISSLRGFFLQDYKSFIANAKQTYGISALLVYYFFHFDGDGDARRIKAFLAALHAGKTNDAVIEVLLEGRTYETLQNEITDKWKRKGVKFTFGS
jgi:SLA1 homology domain 1, SHD1